MLHILFEHVHISSERNQEAIIAELREEMEKLSKYEEAKARLTEMEALPEDDKLSQVHGRK